MNTKTTGYSNNKYDFSTKKYCQTLNLKDDAELIQKYRHVHSQEGHWPVILQGIRSIGILEMEIFMIDNRLFMIVETPLDFDWNTAFAKLATLPRQAEWEDHVSIFQDSETGKSSAEKWLLMDRIFHLY